MGAGWEGVGQGMVKGACVLVAESLIGPHRTEQRVRSSGECRARMKGGMPQRPAAGDACIPRATLAQAGMCPLAHGKPPTSRRCRPSNRMFRIACTDFLVP